LRGFLRLENQKKNIKKINFISFLLDFLQNIKQFAENPCYDYVFAIFCVKNSTFVLLKFCVKTPKSL